MHKRITNGLFYIKNFKAFSELVRLEHAVMYALAVIIGALMVNIQVPIEKLFFGIVIAVLIEFGAFSLNDYIDIKADKENRRFDRPIVRKEVSPSTALFIGILSLLLANIISLSMLDPFSFNVVLFFTLLSLAYDLFLKNLPLVGNVSIALTMAIPFVFGALLSSPGIINNSNALQPVLFLSGIAFFVGTGREIMKDIEDMRGDSLAGGKTLPILIGKANAARLAVFFFIISVILSIIPIFSFFSNNLFYLIVAITDIMLLDISKDLFFDQSLATLRKGRKLTLFAIVVGLFAFLLAALFK